jgi:hypothetical protein
MVLGTHPTKPYLRRIWVAPFVDLLYCTPFGKPGGAISVYSSASSMSDDEVVVTIGATVIGPALWAFWLFRIARVGAVRPGRAGVRAIGLALVACSVFIFGVLKTAASFDVVNAPPYLFMYLVAGLAWLRVAEWFFRFAGLSARDDIVERRNMAALPAFVGALAGVTFCYAGANVGDGPGWWVVVFSAGLATATLFGAWLALGSLGDGIDAVTIDRDTAAGVRLGAFLAACGVVLGRAVAGDWESATQTVVDAAPALPVVILMLGAALVVERLARPTPRRPRAPLFLLGIVPAVLYLGIAAVAYAAIASAR